MLFNINSEQLVQNQIPWDSWFLQILLKLFFWVQNMIPKGQLSVVMDHLILRSLIMFLKYYLLLLLYLCGEEEKSKSIENLIVH